MAVSPFESGFQMIFYDADEYWHCEHGLGPLEFDSKGKFFRAIRDVAFVRVISSGMAGSSLWLYFLTEGEEGEEQVLPAEFIIDGFPMAVSSRMSESMIEVSIEVGNLQKDTEGGFVLEIRNRHSHAVDSIFSGDDLPSLRIHRIGY
jgi:hypothetical protein